MSTEESARAYLEETRDLPREVKAKTYDRLPTQVKSTVQRLQKQAYFVPENAMLDDRKEHLSPSGKYKLVVTPYRTSAGGWAYSQGLVYRLTDDKLVAEVQRNYRSFPFAWVENHAKGGFLLCGEDYQGQTVINLETGGRRDHLPSGAQNGVGFCWAAIHPSPNGKVIAVEGCFWAAPYEIRFYDFAEPMLPPWVQISDGGELSNFFGWTDDEHATMGGYENVYKPLDKSESDLYQAKKKGEITEDTLDKYLEDEDNWEDRKVNVREWVRPSALEALTTFTKEFFKWRREQDMKVHPDLLVNARALLDQLTAAELEAFEKTDEKALADWAFGNEMVAA